VTTTIYAVISSSTERRRAREVRGSCADAAGSPAMSKAEPRGGWSRAWHDQRRARGVCGKCPQPPDINARTGEPFWYCRACRTRLNEQRVEARAAGQTRAPRHWWGNKGSNERRRSTADRSPRRFPSALTIEQK
jgi:ribosomal protein L37AE/L43A